MIEPNPKADLLRYLQEARDALLWKLDGLSEYDVRRPLTPTGTNLLGLVKHVASMELGYFGDTFGRPFFGEEPPPWWYTESAEPESDMWATADESREEIVGLYRQAWEHSNGTIATLALDATGHVPWWPEERREVTLHHILVRVISETQRHAGHADIVRELIDGAVGYAQGNDNMPPGDGAWRESHRSRLERAARKASGREDSEDSTDAGPDGFNGDGD
ncbi:DinB family protein [Streptomyces sp. NPDC000878]